MTYDDIESAKLAALGDKLNAKVINECGGDLVPTAFEGLKGLLCIAFTSRTGSTFLVKTLEQKYTLSNFGETMNPVGLLRVQKENGFSNVSEAAEKSISDGLENNWFAFKAASKGILTAEKLGLMRAAGDNLHYAFLQRRNIVAQAVSIAKARTSGQYHSTQKAKSKVTEDDYDYDQMAKLLRTIFRSNARLLDYLLAAGKPIVSFEYERFEVGDWSVVDGYLDQIGIPKRPSEDAGKNQVKKLDRKINHLWEDRFRTELATAEQKVIDNYEKKFVEPLLNKI